MKFNMVNDFDSKFFIESVRKYKFLYDYEHPDYKNIVMKRIRWALIAQQFDISRDEAMLKWKSLRDRYVKEKKKYPAERSCAAGERDHSAPKWKLFSLLDEFLNETITPGIYTPMRVDTGNDFNIFYDSGDGADPEPPSQSPDQCPSTSGAMYTAAEVPMQSSQDPLAFLKTPSSQPNVKRKKTQKIEQSICSLINTVTKNLVRVQQDDSNGKCVVHDEAYYFFNYLMERYRHLSSEDDKAEARSRIESIFNELEGL